MAKSPKTSKKSTVIRSMTGFGVGSASNREVAVEVELKSANSRYLDLIFRLPRAYNQFEGDLRAELGKGIERGRLEISVNRVTRGGQPVEVLFNRHAYESLVGIYKKVGKELGASAEETRTAIFANVLARQEVIEVQQGTLDPADEKSLLMAAISKAAEALQRMRIREGAHLAADIARRIVALRSTRKEIGEIVAKRPEVVRDRMIAAIQRLAEEVQVDQNRVYTEIALLADRADVTEELVRLDSHLSHFDEILAAGSAGKKLDFLLQELLREFNTIGSKAQDAQVQALIVGAKSELEKIREQVQNLE